MVLQRSVGCHRVPFEGSAKGFCKGFRVWGLGVRSGLRMLFAFALCALGFPRVNGSFSLRPGGCEDSFLPTPPAPTSRAVIENEPLRNQVFLR